MRVPCWTVRWWARQGEFSCDERKRVAAFTDEKEAVEFKKSLDAAFELIGVTWHNEVTVTEEKA